jgi:phosphoenolpyruvate synthase/pyruvate phosphate dikinase
VGEITRRLTRDLAALTGVTQSINGEGGVVAFGLNAGIARGRLKIFATQEQLEHGEYARSDVVLLPETVAELAPVAGIVTLGEGNPLSHVQLLARNFGIPNIAIASDVLPLVEPLENRDVLVAVATDGSLALLPLADVPAQLQALVIPANERGAQLTVPHPDLTATEPIRLAALNAGLSGRVVGPKAANLGELATLFPGRVAPAIAIPFGIYAEHMGGGQDSPRARLIDAYAQHAAGVVNDERLTALLDGIRRQIAAVRITPERRQEMLAAMREEFGEPGTYGLFVRSDTNVEDLPQFTGAGLSETLPNITGIDELFAAIPRVWSSVLSPRATAWRSSLLTNPEEVYASVLLMRSVPSDKSGVMITASLGNAQPGLTVSAAWGVGGAVGGEPAETVLLHADGGETLVSEAKTAYRRAIDPAGGVTWQPAADGQVLSAEDKHALRALAREVQQRYEPVFDENGIARPWDIEFGFVDGELTLFQIRPLVERGQQLADRIVGLLVPRRQASPPESVELDELPLTAGG